MKSRPLGIQSILATDHNTRRDDSRGGSFMLAHEQLGALAMPTNPTNGQTETITINGTAIVLTYVTSIGSSANNILIQGTAALTNAAKVNFLRRPDITNANQVKASVPNQALLQYLGWSLPSGGTTITPFSLNKVVNGASANLTSFTASTTVTGASWTSQTMQLYVEDGTYFVGTTRVIFLGSSTPTVTAPVSNPRIDVLTIDSSGTLAWTTGTESATPSAPAYPAGKVPICELYNVVSETALYDIENQQSGQGYISNDVRPLLGGSYISSQSQIGSGIVIFDPGSDAQGDLLYNNGSGWVLLSPGTAGFFLKTQGSGANPIWAQPVSNTASGASSYSGATGTQTIAHGLGRTPQFVRIIANSTALSAGTIPVTSTGDLNNVCVFMGNNAAAMDVGSDASHAVNIICQTGGSAASYVATLTVDATNIYLAWTKVGSPNLVNFIWEAQ